MPPAPEKSLGLSLQNVYETLAICVPTLVEATQGRVTKAICDRRLDRWSRRIVANARMHVHVRGGEHFDRGRTYVVMSNHQSLYDIPVLFYVLGPNLRMVTKKELFDVPIFGTAMDLAGFIKIDRGNRASAKESLTVAGQMLKSGTSVWIAPEGTRSVSGKLLPFKKGAFYLAFEAGLPILPVTLDGTREALLAKGLRSVAGARIDVTIHPPIDPATYKADGRDGRMQLMADVRTAIEAGLGAPMEVEPA